MAKTIWKAPLSIIHQQAISVPRGAEMLCCKLQYGQPNLWFSCDPSQPLEQRWIAMVGTGLATPEDARYVDTLLLQEGTFVLHVFEKDGT